MTPESKSKHKPEPSAAMLQTSWRELESKAQGDFSLFCQNFPGISSAAGALIRYSFIKAVLSEMSPAAPKGVGALIQHPLDRTLFEIKVNHLSTVADPARSVKLAMRSAQSGKAYLQKRTPKLRSQTELNLTFLERSLVEIPKIAAVPRPQS